MLPNRRESNAKNVGVHRSCLNGAIESLCCAPKGFLKDRQAKTTSDDRL